MLPSKSPEFLFSGTYGRCHHRQGYSVGFAFLYCLALSVLYVGALYALVPPKIRKLDRDNTRHIQWRSMASVLVSVVAVATYPMLFCKSHDESATFSITEVTLLSRNVIGVLVHTVVLYFGPVVASLIRVGEVRDMEIARGKRPGTYEEEVLKQLVMPTWNAFFSPRKRKDRWISIRNFIVAPWTEEIVFRGCMVPALLGTGLSPLKTAFVAPLFFGVAHAHHALTRISKGELLNQVLFMTVFQFLYTSLFGAYAVHAFIRTGSITAVTASHAYCNWMGLPDINFTQPRHHMYKHRKILLTAFFIGTFGFKWFFSSQILLPIPSVLLQTINGAEKL